MALTTMQTIPISGATLVARVSDYQERKAIAVDEGRCLRCSSPPAEDSDFCEAHRDDNREWAKSGMRARRRKWAQQRLCLDCGKRRKLGRKRCTACLIKRDRLRSAGVKKVVKQQPKLVTRVEGDGYERSRNVGQGKRGPQPRGQRDDQDLDHSAKYRDRARSGLAAARAPEMSEVPRIQREDGVRAALGLLLLAIRIDIGVLKRNGDKDGLRSVMDELNRDDDEE